MPKAGLMVDESTISLYHNGESFHHTQSPTQGGGAA
jgi:hypothetical protein